MSEIRLKNAVNVIRPTISDVALSILYHRQMNIVDKFCQYFYKERVETRQKRQYRIDVVNMLCIIITLTEINDITV